MLGNDGEREVLSGLKGGEDVVVSAQFMLDSESRFREAVQMMMLLDGSEEARRKRNPGRTGAGCDAVGNEDGRPAEAFPRPMPRP